MFSLIFEVTTLLTTKIGVFWDAVLRSLVQIYNIHGVTLQKTATFMDTELRKVKSRTLLKILQENLTEHTKT